MTVTARVKNKILDYDGQIYVCLDSFSAIRECYQRHVSLGRDPKDLVILVENEVLLKFVFNSFPFVTGRIKR